MPEYWGGDIKWVTPAELRNEINTVFDTAKHLTKAGFESASLRMMPAGTILLTTRAPIGKLALAGDEMCCNQGFKCLICPETVNNEWLCRLLKHRVPELQAMGTGATFKELSKRAISDYKICVPPMEAQIDIVKKLTKLDEVLANCRALLSALDDLVKSQFMEIFSECLGDKVSLSDVVWFQEGPGVRNYQYTAHGVKLLNVANLHDGELDISNTGRYISEEEAYGRYRHFLVEEGDLIIASSGIKVDYFDQKMGFAKKEQLPLCMNTSTIRFRAIDSRLNMIFFMYYLKSDDFKQQLARQITGSAQLNFGPSHLKKMSVPMPPFALQQQFADFVAQVDKLGFDCCREIVCCGVLFSSMSASLLCT